MAMKLTGKDPIASAALDIIAFDGIDKLTMNTLAESLGVNKSSLYHWFASKDEILEYIYRKGHENLMKGGFKLSLEGSAEDVLERAAEGWRKIFSSDDTVPYLRAVYSLRFSDGRAEEEARSVRLMIQSQTDVILSSLGTDNPFLSSLFSSLLLQHLERMLEGEEGDFSRDAASFAALLEKS